MSESKFNIGSLVIDKSQRAIGIIVGKEYVVPFREWLYHVRYLIVGNSLDCQLWGDLPYYEYSLPKMCLVYQGEEESEG